MGTAVLNTVRQAASEHYKQPRGSRRNLLAAEGAPRVYAEVRFWWSLAEARGEGVRFDSGLAARSGRPRCLAVCKSGPRKYHAGDHKAQKGKVTPLAHVKSILSIVAETAWALGTSMLAGLPLLT